MRVNDLFAAAAKEAIRVRDGRTFLLGAVGVRSDGTLVRARNGSPMEPSPSSHAESRLSRKLDIGSEVYVVRLLKTGQYANSRPCLSCQLRLRSRGCKRVYYTITATEYGVMDL